MSLHLVTGGSGFVGSNIARLLVERREPARALDVWKADDLPEEVEFVEADINDVEAVEKAMYGVTCVHHNAALVPLAKAGKQYWTVNVEGTRVALEAAARAKVRLFAHMSSSAVFGAPDEMPVTNDSPRKPVEIYGEAKLAAENLVITASREGLPAAVIRPRTTIGRGRLGIFQILFEWVRDGANVFVIGSGNHKFQFLHVDDLCEVSIQVCLQEKEGLFNLGTDRFGTLRETLENLVHEAGPRSRVKSLPVGPSIGTLTVLDKLGLSPLSAWHYLTYHKAYFFDSEPVYRALNWRPRYSNDEMFLSSYDWFLRHYDEDRASAVGSSHKRPVRQGILKLLKALS